MIESWYRTPLEPGLRKVLHEKSDFLGFLQTGGYLGLLALTGSAVLWASSRFSWPVTFLLLLVHGSFWAFMINGFHELIHDSVFRTRSLNRFFLRILSFLGWYNHHFFWASHTLHHRHTLHPPRDLEVVLPVRLKLADFLKSALVNPWGLWWSLKNTWRTAQGRLEGDWEHSLFPETKPERKAKLRNWARLVLLGQGMIVVVSVLRGWWMLPVVTTFAPFYGGALFYLHNNTQHVGLTDNVPDFRLCCRTMLINPLFQFVYWHMNYHTEHHMYVSVPCYKLGRLHRAIRHDLPDCPRGLFQTWKIILTILRRQKVEPGYQFRAELPLRDSEGVRN